MGLEVVCSYWLGHVQSMWYVTADSPDRDVILVPGLNLLSAAERKVSPAHGCVLKCNHHASP